MSGGKLSAHGIFEASDVAEPYRLANDIYLVGTQERGVTLYNQQVRAHNLAWALHELDRTGKRRLGTVGVIGGGATGLTITAALLGLYKGDISLTLFERLWDLCPMQQGADTRWLHPHIYDWPNLGSRAPSASLPVLNWAEGRASDVARILLRGFGEFCKHYSTTQLKVITGLREFRVDTSSRSIKWVGSVCEQKELFFEPKAAKGDYSTFDTIIIATGFGREREHPPYATTSYWHNDIYGQPIPDGKARHFIISGYGDGALVDLCRLAIERFRQDTILRELFGQELESFEETLRPILETSSSANLFEHFRRLYDIHLTKPISQLSVRIRRDTLITLNIRGAKRADRDLRTVFGPTSSVVNRLLLYMLYTCGAFTTSTTSLQDCAASVGASNSDVICRHGADAASHLAGFVSDFNAIKDRLKAMRLAQAQVPRRLWPPGAFPVANLGGQR